MKLIVGLGNPEKKYDHTRHNVGFMMIDMYARSHNIVLHEAPKYKAFIAELFVGEEKIILLKPTTYYNLSGEAVRKVADFYKITPEDILIIHDELMLPIGTVRVRHGGSDAGNNGIKSINQLVSPTTARIRIGIYNELRDQIDDADFVLGVLSQQEQHTLQLLQPKIVETIDDFVAGLLRYETHRITH